MKDTPYVWQQAENCKAFVYALNDNGVNDFSFIVQAGNNTKKEERIATLACAAPELLEKLSLMTELCYIKYGNLDSSVWKEIQKAKALIESLSDCKEQ